MLNNTVKFEQLINSHIEDMILSDNTDKTNEKLVLDKVNEYSTLIGKDFFTFTYDDLISMFNYYTWTKDNVFHNRKSIILRFIDFAEQNGYCSQQFKMDFKKRLKKDDVNKDVIFENELFESFDELYDLIKKIETCIDLEEIDKSQMTIAVLYLVWTGFTLDEITKIEENSFIYETGEIKSENKTFIIEDSRIKGLLENIKNEKEVTVGFRGRRGKSEKYNEITTRRYVNTGYLIKSLSENGVSVPYLRTLVATYNKLIKLLPITDKDYAKRITYKMLFQSGLYARIRTAEQSLGKDISIKIVDKFDKEMNGELLEGKTLDDLTTQFKVRRIINEYTEYKNFLNTRG